MGSLSSPIVNPTRPFNFIGVDYCGPFYTKYSLRRIGVTRAALGERGGVDHTYYPPPQLKIIFIIQIK